MNFSAALSMRELIIGVSTKLTMSETPMANAIVRPNELRKRPTMPAMNATGRKTTMSERVVARTARPISRVPSIAAWAGVFPFSSMCR